MLQDRADRAARYAKIQEEDKAAKEAAEQARQAQQEARKEAMLRERRYAVASFHQCHMQRSRINTLSVSVMYYFPCFVNILM